MRLLLVDDDKAFRATLRDLLTRRAATIHVEEAADADAAFHMITRRRPDVVLMDLTMPRVSGIEATRRVKARWPDLPVVVLTVHDEPSYERIPLARALQRVLGTRNPLAMGYRWRVRDWSGGHSFSSATADAPGNLSVNRHRAIPVTSARSHRYAYRTYGSPHVEGAGHH